MKKPEQIQNPDYTSLIEAVKDYIDLMEDEDACEDDLDNYQNEIFERAVQALYVEKAFDWINKKIGEFK